MIEFARRKMLSIWIEIYDGTITDVYLERKRKNNSSESTLITSSLSRRSSSRFSLSYRSLFFVFVVCLFHSHLSAFFLSRLVLEGQELCLRLSSHDDYMDGRQQPPADQLETMMEDRYRCC